MTFKKTEKKKTHMHFGERKSGRGRWKEKEKNIQANTLNT